ncbi:MAG: sigma-54 interaction domain-containing protein [Thermacetogeniaceae bacterium]
MKKDSYAELKEQLEKLTREKDLLLKALDVLEDGIHMVDASGRTILYTRGMEKIENLKSEYVLGKHISETYQLDDQSSILLKVLKSGIAIRNHHTTYITSQGKTASIITNTYPIFQDGKIIGAVSVNRDITKVRELAEKVIKLQRDLYAHQKKNKQNGTQFCFDDIIGTSKKIKETIEIAKKFAENLSPVLIQGETGTGKELFAQSIHNYSPRADGPFVAINCAAIPETLLEGILFGTCKGAFTGAEDRKGLFEEASEGTLFLDEINSMSLFLQSKLLRVLQSKTIRRVGGNKDISVNPRIISAINVDPAEAITKGQLRNDLYYRLAAVTLVIPPLRERIEDIPLLVKHFIEKNNRIMGKNIQNVSNDVLNILRKYNWPGNVRELEHVIEHAMNMVESSDTTIHVQHLPPHLREKFNHSHHFYRDYQVNNLRETLLGIERDIIIQELINNHNNISKTAAKLGVSRQYLQYRIKRLNINVNGS